MILHTNLGRAPLAQAARQAVEREARGYSNLELDLETGDRGSRHDHVRELLCELTGAQDAIVVNNGAAAVLLATAALAGAGENVVSRGQLVETVAASVPDVVAQSGSTLIESARRTAHGSPITGRRSPTPTNRRSSESTSRTSARSDSCRRSRSRR